MEVGKSYKRDGWIYTPLMVDGGSAFVKYGKVDAVQDNRTVIHFNNYHLYKEVKPRIKRKVWFVHIPGFADDANTYGFPSEERARLYASGWGYRGEEKHAKPIAITCSEVEIEQGEGL